MALTLPPKTHTVSVSLHPAFALRAGSPQFLPLITTATLRAQRWASLESGPVRDFDIRVNPPFDDALAAMRDTRVVAIDVETPRENPTQITIVGLATSERTAFVWSWRDETIEFLRGILVDSRLIKVGHNFAYDTLAFAAYQNDVEWPVVDTIQAGALLWPPFGEAKTRPWLSLPLCVTRIADGVPYWKEPEDEATKALYRVMFPGMPEWQFPLAYCGLDCLFTWRLWAAQRELLARDGMLPLFEEVVAPAAPVLIRLKQRGLPLDQSMVAQLRQDAERLIKQRDGQVQSAADARHQARLAAIQRRVQGLIAARGLAEDWLRRPPATICQKHPEYAGLTKRQKCPDCAAIYVAEAPKRQEISELTKTAAEGRTLATRLGGVFDAASDDSWRWLLFDKATGLGLKPATFTDKRKQPKVDEDAIETLQRRYPEIELLRWRADRQHAQRRISNVLGVRPEKDGCVHFTYTMHRTETGRIASGADDAEPTKFVDSPGNAQNIPECDRVIYSPLDPERVFVQTDWANAEARVLAWIARDERMLGAFTQGIDVYNLIAAELYGISPEDARTTFVTFGGKQDTARQAGKKWRLARNYGMGLLKATRLFGIKMAEAQRLDAIDRKAWPRIYEWQEEVVARVEQDGALRNPFGRLLRFHGFRKDAGGRRTLTDREEALAFLPQSTVGDMCKVVLPILDRIGVLGTVTLKTTTHDSFLFECHRTEVAEVIDETRRIMQREWKELGWLDGHGWFVCPTDFTVGRNWGRYHATENPAGLRPWVPSGAPLAAAATATA